MTTTTIHLRSGRLLLWLALAWLGGCGPGVGGTGSGTEPPLVTFGATSSPVCSSSLAPKLVCTSVTGAPARDGTGLVSYGGPSPLGRLRAVFEGQALQARIDCVGWQFDGEWGTDTRGRQRYFGSLVRERAGEATPAQVELRVLPDGALSATVFDLQERSVLGPVDLRPDNTPTPPTCP